jgi:uncharacterized lipoprotein YajG
MSLNMTYLFRKLVLLTVAATMLQACVTNPNADEKPSAVAYDADCYVTGSLNKIRSADCQKAKRDRGVSTVDPKSINTGSKMTPGDVSK